MSEEKDDQVISLEFSDRGGYISEVDIHVKDKIVEIWDDYNDYASTIPFDTFLEIAKKIKEQISNGKEK